MRREARPPDGVRAFRHGKGPQGFCNDQMYRASADAWASLRVPGSLNGIFFLMKDCSEDCVEKRLRMPASSLGADAPTPPGPWQTWHFFWKSAAAAALLPVGLPLAVVVPVVLGDGGGAFFVEDFCSDLLPDLDLEVDLLLDLEPDFADLPPDLEPDFDAADLPPDLDELADCCPLLDPEAPCLLEPQPERTIPRPRTTVTTSALRRML